MGRGKIPIASFESRWSWGAASYAFTWTTTPMGGGRLDPPAGPAWFQPIPTTPDTWLEVKGEGERTAVELAEVIGAVMEAEEETGQVAAELSGRYEEIDLIYTISEILGHTIRLDEAANRILREVSAVVRARRATLLVHDPRAHVLRLPPPPRGGARGKPPRAGGGPEADSAPGVRPRRDGRPHT